MAIKLDTRLRPSARPTSDAFGPEPTPSPLRSAATMFGAVAKAGSNISQIIEQSDKNAQTLIGLEAYHFAQNELKAATTNVRAAITEGNQEKIEQAKNELANKFASGSFDLNNFKPEGVTKQLTRPDVLTNYRSQINNQYEKAVQGLEGYESNFNIISRLERGEKLRNKDYNNLIAEFQDTSKEVPLDQVTIKLDEFQDEYFLDLLNTSYDTLKQQDDYNLSLGVASQQTEFAETFLESKINDFTRYALLGATSIHTTDELDDYKKYIAQTYNKVSLFTESEDGLSNILTELDKRKKDIASNVKTETKALAEIKFNPVNDMFKKVSDASDLSKFLENYNKIIDYTNNDFDESLVSSLSAADQKTYKLIKELEPLLFPENYVEKDSKLVIEPLLWKYIPGDDAFSQLEELKDLKLSSETMTFLETMFSRFRTEYNGHIEDNDMAAAFSLINPDIKEALDDNDIVQANNIYQKLYTKKDGEYFIEGLVPVLADLSFPKNFVGTNAESIQEASIQMVSKATDSPEARKIYLTALESMVSFKGVDSSEQNVYQLTKIALESNFSDTEILNQAKFIVAKDLTMSDTENQIIDDINSALSGISGFDTKSIDTDLLGDQDLAIVNNALSNASNPTTDYYSDLLQGLIKTSVKNAKTQNPDASIGDITNTVLAELKVYDDSLRGRLPLELNIDPRTLNFGIFPADAPNVDVTLPPSFVNSIREKGLGILRLFGEDAPFSGTKEKFQQGQQQIAGEVWIAASLMLHLTKADPNELDRLFAESGLNTDIKNLKGIDRRLTSKEMKALALGILRNKNIPDTAKLPFGLSGIFGPKSGYVSQGNIQVTYDGDYVIVKHNAGSNNYVRVTDLEGGNPYPTIEEVEKLARMILREENLLFDFEFSGKGKTGEVVDRILKDFENDNLVLKGTEQKLAEEKDKLRSLEEFREGGGQRTGPKINTVKENIDKLIAEIEAEVEAERKAKLIAKVEAKRKAELND